MTELYIPTTEEIKRDATRLGGWQPEAFDRWLAAHDAEVRARALDDAAEALETYARETYWRDDSTFHTINKDAVTDAAKRIRDRARAERGEQ